jgi:malate dehydrogenase (oxaloacetate-decarboxylating)(NADP+)
MNMLESVGTLSTAPHPARGMALLRDPLLNKGTAFTEQERQALALLGLVPAHVLSLDEQAEGRLKNLRRLPNDLEKYVSLGRRGRRCRG